MRLESPGELDTEGCEWLSIVARTLDSAPRVDQARSLAGKVLDHADRDALHSRACAEPAKLGCILLSLCGIAPFFANVLVRHPEFLLELLDSNLEAPRSPRELGTKLAALLDQPGDDDPAIRLRVFKYSELARITVRDCCDEWVPLSRSETTLLELSQLADTILDQSLQLAKIRVGQQHDAPTYRDDEGVAKPLRFCVLGLGKLGASELNYSSDVDLVYLYESAPAHCSAEGAEPTSYFSRLAREFGSIVSSNLSEGFLYRVDVDLRPDGAQGALVVTDEALVGYYESWAHTWEKAAFMKARPVAGDADLGWQAIVAATPAIYHAGMNYRIADGIRSLKMKIQSVRGGNPDAPSIKIDPGGIRDVEFIAQALQLLHGGRIPQLRDRSTQGALRNLEAVGLLGPETAIKLHETYLFLRRVENRLQMEGERQIHRLPKTDDGMQRLARAMNYLQSDGSIRLQHELDRQRKFLSSLALDSLGEGNHSRVQDLFERAVPELLKLDVTRDLVRELISRFASGIDDSPDAERALNNLDRFIQGTGRRRFYIELLLDRPELVPRLVSLFGASNFLSSYLARYPRLIEPLFDDPNILLFDRAQLHADCANVLAQCAAEAGGDRGLETQLDALRLFHHRQVVNVGLLDLAKKTQRDETEYALSEIAEVCIEEALAIGREQLAARGFVAPEGAQRGGFLVVGMGKLASHELTYGSDLDLVFLYQSADDVPGSNAAVQDYFARLTQRFISALQTATELGFCYEVDARLRPSGNQGMLVCSTQAFARYHAETAATWERQALLRGRPVAGSERLGKHYQDLRTEILSRPNPEDLASEIHHVRARMEEELARETSQHRDYKTGRGGALDIECAVQYLQLLHGAKHPELLEVATLDVQRENLERLGLIDSDCARILREGWTFLQELGSRLRIVENRSISSLDTEQSNLETLARQLDYADTGSEGGARRALLKDYKDITESIRSVYLELLGKKGPG